MTKNLSVISVLIKHLSIRQLLLLAFLLVGLLPAMLVSFLSFYQARTVLKKELVRDMQTLSQTVANDVNRMMFERIQNVVSWSQLAVMQEVLVEDVDKRLSIFLKELNASYDGIYDHIYVVDIHNKVISSSSSHQLGSTKNLFTPWFSYGLAHKKIQFYIIENNVLAISQDIINNNSNQVIGQLFVEFNWQQIQNLLNASVREPASAALLSEKNEVLAATKNWHKEAGYEMRATSLVNSESLPKWSVRVEKLHSIAVAPLHRLGYVFLALLATTLILSTILVTPIAQAITQPLAKLTAFVRSFKQVDLVETPKSGPPEIQELGIAFEDLMQSLVKTQDNLMQAAKLAVAGEMAAAMSHEIRTPLGILRSSADLLLREPKLTNDGKEVLGFIISETERLNKLVSTLIDASRARAPVFMLTDLTELIHHASALLRTQAEAKNITLRVESSEVIMLELDADQITQVLMNLLMNAIQILSAGGEINVLTHQKQGMALIEIADNGPGIPAESQEKIFEPFFTQRAGGVGLGLAIVRQIVEAHQGEIVCSSSQTGGAQFTISLPIKNTANN